MAVAARCAAWTSPGAHALGGLHLATPPAAVVSRMLWSHRGAIIAVPSKWCHAAILHKGSKTGRKLVLEPAAGAAFRFFLDDDLRESSRFRFENFAKPETRAFSQIQITESEIESVLSPRNFEISR